MSALKKYIQPESKELFYLVGMFRTQSPGDNISVALRKLLQGGRREVRLYTCLQQREQTVWKANIRYQVKEFSILCMGRCKPLGSLNSSLLYAPQLSLANPVSLFTLRSGDGYFLHSPSSSAITMEGRGQQYPLCNSFGSHHSYLEARNCWWLWHFLLINMAGEICILHTHTQTPNSLGLIDSISNKSTSHQIMNKSSKF